MPFLQIGPRRALPEPIADGLVDSLLNVDPWMHHGSSSRACAVTMADGSIKPRVSITVIDQFDDAWAAGFMDLAFDGSVPIANIAAIEPSAHALPADLATKAMHGEEWRMGAYRYAVVLHTGDVFTLGDGVAVWLPDSLTASEIADVIPNPSEDYTPGGRIPRPESCYISTPQLYDADQDTYERHFMETASTDVTPKAAVALQRAHAYAQAFSPRERPLAYAAMSDRLTTGVSRYERFMGDDIDLLVRFAQREGSLDVPKDHIEGGRRLDMVGIAMALAMGDLSDADRRRLDEIPGWEAAAENAGSRVIGFEQLRHYGRGKD